MYAVHINLTLISYLLECDHPVGAGFQFESACNLFIRNLCLSLQIYTIDVERFKMEGVGGDKHVPVMA